MKVSVVTLSLLLLTATCSIQVLAQPVAVLTPNTCCLKVFDKKIPMQRLVSYTRITNKLCPREAVIFKIKQGKDVCTDPNEKWVQNSMKYLDQKSQKPRP